jgi:hypothetical protein
VTRGPIHSLLEREPELIQLTRHMEAAAGGEGGVVLLEGAAGIGKTALLGAACERARELSMQTAAARAGELESGPADVLAGVLPAVEPASGRPQGRYRRASQLTVPDRQRPFLGLSTIALSRPLASLLAKENGLGKTGFPCGSKPILPRTPTPVRFRLKNRPSWSTATFRKRAILDTLPDSQPARQRKRIPSLVWKMTRMTRRSPWEVRPTNGP